jgi:uncharacterized DUF497 family protein
MTLSLSPDSLRELFFAQSIDGFFIMMLDEPIDWSDEEDRFVLLGLSAALRVLVVVYCLREAGQVIRLISARKATRSERTQYGTRD